MCRCALCTMHLTPIELNETIYLVWHTVDTITVSFLRLFIYVRVGGRLVVVAIRGRSEQLSRKGIFMNFLSPETSQCGITWVEIFCPWYQASLSILLCSSAVYRINNRKTTIRSPSFATLCCTHKHRVNSFIRMVGSFCHCCSFVLRYIQFLCCISGSRE